MDCFTVLMEHTVTLSALTTGTDTGGGTANTYTSRVTGVQCLLKVEGTGEEMMFGQMQLVQTVTVATFYTDFRRGDKVTVTAGPSLVNAHIHITNFKDQPGVDALGFEELLHITGKRLI